MWSNKYCHRGKCLKSLQEVWNWWFNCTCLQKSRWNRYSRSYRTDHSWLQPVTRRRWHRWALREDRRTSIRIRPHHQGMLDRGGRWEWIWRKHREDMPYRRLLGLRQKGQISSPKNWQDWQAVQEEQQGNKESLRQVRRLKQRLRRMTQDKYKEI